MSDGTVTTLSQDCYSHHPLVLAHVEEYVTKMGPLAGDIGAGKAVHVGAGLHLRETDGLE